VVDPKAVGPFEQVTEALKFLVTQVCETRGVNFEVPHSLRRMTKREVLDWIAEQWDVLGDTFTMITVNQRGSPVRYPNEFLSPTGKP
jgi:hypothetical protein